MGNCISALGHYFFSGILTRRINSILKHVIGNTVSDVSLYKTQCEVNSENVSHFEKLIMLVREKGVFHQWCDMVCELSNTVDFEKSVCMILNYIILVPTFGIAYLLCFYTMLIDVIVYKLEQCQTVDVEHILNVVQMYIIEHKGVGILFRVIMLL